MSKIEIVGAKLVGGLFCHYTFREEIGKNRHDYIKVKSERPMHDDLRNAFAALTIHLPVIIQDVKPGEIADINSGINGFTGTDEVKAMLEKFTVIEVNLEKEEARAQLIGTKILDLGLLVIETPMVRFAGDYHYKLEYQFGIDALFYEVALYREGKQAPEIITPELPFGGDPDAGEEKEKPKRGRKKKGILEGTTVTMSTGNGPGVTMSGEDFEARIGALGNKGDYTPEPDAEFNKPATEFYDPSRVGHGE